MTHESRAPLIVAIVLLLLLVLYVGSYVAVVQPYARYASGYEHYRFPGAACGRFFWPLEQINRKVRPGEWQFPP